MAVTLRLYKIGKKGYPTYKIVAVNRRYKANGSYIESVGTYDPHMEKSALILKKDRFDYWATRGAIISEGLGKLLKNTK